MKGDIFEAISGISGALLSWVKKNQPKYLGTFRNWVDQNQIYENALKNLSNTSFDQTLDYLSSMYTCKMHCA